MLWTEGPGDWWAWGSGLIWKELLLLPFTSWRPGSYLRQKREEARWSKTTWGGTAGGTAAQTWPQGKRSALLQLLPVKFINLCLSQGDGCGQGTRADGPGRAQLIFQLDTWGHSSTSLLTTSPDNEWKAATCHTTCSSITWQGSHAGPTLLTSCLAAQEARCILLLLLQLVQPHPSCLPHPHSPLQSQPSCQQLFCWIHEKLPWERIHSERRWATDVTSMEVPCRLKHPTILGRVSLFRSGWHSEGFRWGRLRPDPERWSGPCLCPQ